jgi:hypothetical protein
MTEPSTPQMPLDGIGGRVLARLLQLPFVRYHRVQLGFAETPVQYERFLAEVVGPRLDAHPGRLGVFGVGAHTDLAMRVVPGLAARVRCFTDNNAAHWHRRRHDIAVLPPEEAVAQCDVFFLSTAVFQRVLTADLRALGFRGPLVSVDDVVPPAWFLGRAA